jgi:hypothetical protein
VKEYYNLEKLIKIELEDQELSYYYSYEKERRFLGINVRGAGFYYHLLECKMSIPDNCTFDGTDVWVKPHVILHYEAKHFRRYDFDTYKEAEQFASEIMEETNVEWIS